ncbi:MAG: glycosyltransferase [Lachnospiraceae bacterium]|nr:glycosyltransferase [Lachnospiraceae bacterium]
MKYNVPLVIKDNESLSGLIKYIVPGSTVLEFGCANGRMTRHMKEVLNCKVYIMEYEQEAFNDAIQYAEDGICGDIMQFEWVAYFQKIEFDYIIFADVLEHLYNPQQALKETQKLLKRSGEVLISVPNIAHNDILIKLYSNKFDYTKTGLLDDTHIHFFAEDMLEDFCDQADYTIINQDYTYINTGNTEQFNGQLPDINPYIRNLIESRENGQVFQFLLRLQKKEYAKENRTYIQKSESIKGTVPCVIYFDKGNGFDENLIQVLYLEMNADGICNFKQKISIDEDTTRVRIDPCENQSCIIIKKDSFQTWEHPDIQLTENITKEDVTLLFCPDPHIIISCQGKTEINLDYEIAMEGTTAYREALNYLTNNLLDQKIKLEELQNSKNELILTNEKLIRLQAIEENYHMILEKLLLETKDNMIQQLRMSRQLQDSQQEIEQLRWELQNTNEVLHERRMAADYWENWAKVMMTSRSWFITKPFRYALRIGRKLKSVAASVVRKDTPKETVSVEDIKFSVIMPVYNVDIKWLEKAINSIKTQTYTNWELCMVDDASPDRSIEEYLKKEKNPKIKVKFLEKNGGISQASNEAAKLATGEYVLLMDNDDEISRDALMKFYECIKETDADVIYSDQDIIDEEGKHSCPLYKPDWSPDLFQSQMYLGHLTGFKRELFNQVGGFQKEFDGSQDYDLLFRITEKTSNIAHIPEILYSWRSLPTSTATNPDAKPYAQYAGLHAVQAHLDRKYGNGNAIAKETDNLFVYDVQYQMKESIMISIIMPTKDHADDLKKAVDSIFQKSSYRNFEIIILNNNSEEEETYTYFEEVTREYKNVRVIEAFYEFNWSKLNNHGMKEAKGDVYLFLNNDVQIISSDWMERLASKALLEETGVVGALLLYEDGTIQHGGVVVGFGGYADHAYKGMRPEHSGTPFISPVVTRNVTAVTGACMAIAKKTVEAIGAFDEHFIICGSDVEICIRAFQKGFVNIYDSNVRLYHYESKSRGTFIPQIDFDLSDELYKSYRENGDSYYNNKLDYQCYIPRVKDHPSIIQQQPLDVMNVGVVEIEPIHFRKVSRNQKRINIILPSLNPEHVFGGIATAYKFFETLCNENKCECRIILVDVDPNEAAVELYGEEYLFVSAEDTIETPRQIVAFANRYNRTIPVSDKDYFIFTGWWTAYCIQEEYSNWIGKGLSPNPFIYLIQDYEPGFYAWSTRYMLADASYRTSFEQIAVFNSKELKTYFDNMGYQFAKGYVFEPILNVGLKNHLLKLDETIEKKKQILVYGRPGTERNAFALLVKALRKWVEIQEDVEEWKILSAGEYHKPVALGRGKMLEPVGKLSIEKYAKTLEETYAGVSLMVSPHPSYPPLEMAVFGVKVITNTYANKDLSEFSFNVSSISEASPFHIANCLEDLCNRYDGKGTIDTKTNAAYCNGKDSFPFIKELNAELFL